MKSEPRGAGGVNRPRRETITRVPARELELSTTLNRLIGEANCEATLLPTRSTARDWTKEEVHEVVIRCQQAVIATLRCAIELLALDDLDAYSRLWIREATRKCQEHHERVKFILSEHCPTSIDE